MVEEPDHSRVALRVLQQEVLVADGGQVRLFLGGREVGQVIRLLIRVKPDQVVPDGLRHRRVGEELGERTPPDARDQLVRAESLTVEEHGPLETQIPVGVRDGTDALVVTLPVDPDLLEQPAGDISVLRGRFHVEGSAVHQVGPPVEVELVAFGMPAEIVVVVEKQDAGVGAGLLREVMGGGKS